MKNHFKKKKFKKRVEEWRSFPVVDCSVGVLMDRKQEDEPGENGNVNRVSAYCMQK